MSKQNRAGDVLLEPKVNAICDSINKLQPQEQDDLIYQLEGIIASVLQYRVIILSKNASGKFPQVFRENDLLCIRYHFSRDMVSTPPKNILMQISIGTILACCPHQRIEDIKIDETIGSFSQRFPDLVNFATRVYEQLILKIV